MFTFSKKNFTEFIVFCASAIFIIKLCNGFSMPRESSKTNESSAKNTLNGNTRNSSLARYYRHEPYGLQTYAFGFEVNDTATRNLQFRDERRFKNGTVDGSYGYVRPDGRVTVTHYTVDSKSGFLSQTHSYDLTSKADENADQLNWRAHFRSIKRPEIFMHHPKNEDREKNKEFQENTTKTLKTDYNIDVNHIDLTKDLLSPTLWSIVSGQTSLKGSVGGKDGLQAQQRGFETFEKVIPKEFPLVPFQLPVKMENIQHEMNTERAASFEIETTATTIAQAVMPKSLESDENSDEKSSYWISKIINETQKEFLENIPILL